MMPDDQDLQLITDSPLFDRDWYAARYPDVPLSGLAPSEHFLRVGARLGRDPGPKFSTAGYLDCHPDVAGAGLNPLVHFEKAGRSGILEPLTRGPAAAPLTAAEWVDVVVPVHNALQDTKACLRSLARAPTGFRIRVLIVNDGSDDPTTAWLRWAARSLGTAMAIELIEFSENRGYTVSVNMGLKASRAPFVVLLNSDTVVTPFWLDRLVRCLRSAPDLGIVGPLSNAAGWQNVPDLLAGDGHFAINVLPQGVGPDEMAALVGRGSTRLYPRVPFVNGFCYVIRREVIERVGYMDEDAFPVGYGEEDDYSLRAQDAGFALAIADDAFVFHAKSKSFGTSRRLALSRAGSRALRTKHEVGKVRALKAEASASPVLEAIRARVRGALASLPAAHARTPRDWAFSQRVLLLIPDPGDGEHPAAREAAAMRWLGVEAKVAVRTKDLDRIRKAHAKVPGAQDLFVRFTPLDLVMIAGRFDVVVATDPASEALLARIVECCPWVLPARRAGTQGLDLAAPSKNDPDAVHEPLAGLPEATRINVGQRCQGMDQEELARSAEAHQPRMARRAMSDLMFLAPALAKLRKRSPRPARPRVAVLPVLTPPDRSGRRSIPGSAYVRAILPYGHDGLAGQFDVTVSKNGTLPAPGSADLALIQRDLTDRAWPMFEAWRQRFRAAGGRVIYEVDDDLLDAEGLTARGYKGDPGKLARRVLAYTEAANLITVSTPELADRLPGAEGKARVVPNFIDDRVWDLGSHGAGRQGRARPKGPGQIRIGYMGTHTHYSDLQLVREAMETLRGLYGEAVDVEVIGAFERQPPLFGTRLALPHARAYPDFAQWVQKAADWDVAIIPLALDRFNLAKSDLKFIESAALNVAIACSDVPTYHALARHEENCLLVPNTTQAWVDALQRLIDDPALRRRLANTAHRDVACRRTLQHNAGLHLSVLNSALEAAS